MSFGLLASTHLQIVVGPKTPKGSRVFHAHPGYLPGFWYLDPKGYHWNSSLAGQVFDPDRIDADKAAYFFNGVSGYFRDKGMSNRPQPGGGRGEILPPDARADAVIFVQMIETYRVPVHYLTMREIIRETCETLPGTVYVKMHPLQSEQSRSDLAAYCEGFANASVVDANVHDLIAASDVVVSQNSAVGFEALMHRKPVLTCAACDYHHASLVCRSAADLRENLHRAQTAFEGFPYAQYFYWFLAQNLMEPQKDGFETRAWQRLLAA